MDSQFKRFNENTIRVLALTLILSPLWWLTGLTVFIYHTVSIGLFLWMFFLFAVCNRQIQFPNISKVLFVFLIIYGTSLIFNLGNTVEFDRVMLQEPIRYGQRISSFIVEAFVDNEWIKIATGSTIGHKRLLRTELIETNKVRVQILEANNVPAIAEFGIYKASDRE